MNVQFNRSILAVLIGLLFSLNPFTQAAMYGGGSGTKLDPYQIWTAEQMNTIGANSGDWGKHFKLMDNIDMSAYTGTQYNIIGNSTTGFAGTFDGNGHVISNLTYETMAAVNNVGLFGYTSSVFAKILNLGIENITIASGGNFVGGLVGFNYGGGAIMSCYATGTVGGYRYVGGLVGYTNCGTITSCYATGTVSGFSSVGGLIGLHTCGTITSCYSTSSVSGSGDSIGGLVGNNSGTITSCYATGTVSGFSSVGGLLGRTERGTITSCYATGTVSGSGDYVGGLMGKNYDGTITTCYAAGTVSGNRYVGGLGGYTNRGTISSCYATGSVSGSDSYGYVGGLVGLNMDANIAFCYATGSVIGNWYVGGLVADNRGNWTITACFWDMQTSGRTDSFGGKGLTTEQMKTISVFQNAGWADRGWVINNGVDCPQLSWENTDGVPIPSVVIPFAGSGTTEDPYLISTAQEFALLSWYTDVFNKHIQLTDDIDLSGVLLYPIGDLGSFSGVFDGNGYTVSNAVINQLDSDYHVGLFSIVGLDGQIQNLGIENVNITGSDYVGGLAGLNLGTVTACYATGVVGGSDYVGALVGENNDGTITACYATCSVSGSYRVGGLVGENGGTITSCYATGTVSGSGECVGGLMGENYDGTITTCYATGTVSGYRYVGGLVGYTNRGTISSCYATGTISSYYDVGGLVGRNNQGRVIYCYSVAQRPMWFNLSGLCGSVTTGGDYEDTGNFWDINKSKTTISAMGIGKTTTDMETLSTFTSAGWDFTNETANGIGDIWRMCIDGMVYPHLNWESNASDFACPDGVNIEDLSYYVGQWLMNNCTIDNNYCGGTDLNYSGVVNLDDWAIFAENWLSEIPISDHVFEIEMSLSYDFGEGYASSVPVDYQFDAWMRVDNTIVSGTVKTPTGTVYPAEMEVEEGENWLGIYRASNSLANLADFTDGEYIFTVVYANGISQSTPILFTLEDGSPIPPVESPLIANYPSHNATNVPLTINVQLQPMEDTDSVYGVDWFPIDSNLQALSGSIEGLPYDTTIAGPLNLSPDTLYEIELTANHAIQSTNDDGIPYVVDKDSEVEMHFTTASEP